MTAFKNNLPSEHRFRSSHYQSVGRYGMKWIDEKCVRHVLKCLWNVSDMISIYITCITKIYDDFSIN